MDANGDMGLSQSEAEPARWRELRRRTVSALVIAPIAVAAIIAGETSALVLITLAGCAMAWEVWRMATAKADGPDRLLAPGRRGATKLAIVIGPALGVALAALVDFRAALAFAAAFGLFGAWRAKRRDGARGETSLWLGLGGGLVIAAAAALADLRLDAGGVFIALWLIAVVAAADTGAYLFGRMIGGPKLWPRVSPKKTWAGLIAALICGGAAAAAALALNQAAVSVIAVVCGVLAAAAGQAGDLAESAFKRRFNRKDASGLIPGHGGVLDRMDSLVGATLVVALARAAGIDMWSAS
ncbi:MAG: phosphatidate cytidylyltransferase [Pseudomonadota bacterium]